MVVRTNIIDVPRKPQRCPVCGSRVVDNIYGTGEMAELEYLLEYLQDGIMGGDNIPRRPPIWVCPCGYKRFRKVNFDGSDAPVTVKMLKNVRKKPLTLINFETELANEAMGKNHFESLHHYKVKVVSELGEEETLSITAISEGDAK